MTRLNKIISMIMIFFIIGCEDKNEDDNGIVIYEITTENVSDGPYYFNFVSGTKDNSTWHMVYQNLEVSFGGAKYEMPSFSLHNGVMMAIDNSLKFEEINQSPSPSAFAPENGRMKYEGKNAALLYDMQSHKVLTSKENYIIYDTVTHKVYKIYFDEYSSGVVLFRYAELPGN
tara:strand:+ start:273 stop:791 length:519 start_codon:yes stop_codon:yes gene_type:complete